MKYLAFVILIALPTLGMAQTFIGIRGGLNITSIATTVSSPEMDPAFRAACGLTFERFVGEKTSIGLDLMYNPRGYRGEYYQESEFGFFPGPAIADVYYNYNYFSVPIKASRWFGEKQLIFASIGVAPSRLIKAEVTFRNIRSGAQKFPDISGDIPNVKKFDLAGQVEGGANFPLGEKYSVFGSVAFQYSITPFNEADLMFNVAEARHYGLMISGGVKMKLAD